MAIDLNKAGAQAVGGVTVTVTSLGTNLPNPDSGHSVAQGWRIDVQPPGSASALNGQQIQAAANAAATTLFQGGKPDKPLPDAAWNTLTTSTAGGVATATLVNTPYALTNPTYIVYGT